MWPTNDCTDDEYGSNARFVNTLSVLSFAALGSTIAALSYLAITVNTHTHTIAASYHITLLSG